MPTGFKGVLRIAQPFSCAWVQEVIGTQTKMMNAESAHRAQQAWTQSGRYADYALATLLPEPPGAPEDRAEILRKQWAAPLRIQYLFPQLQATPQDILVVMFHLRQLLSSLIEANRCRGSLKTLPDIERVTREVEQKYMRVYEDVLVIIGYGRLSPLQQHIFRQYFCEIPFGETSADFPA